MIWHFARALSELAWLESDRPRSRIVISSILGSTHMARFCDMPSFASSRVRSPTSITALFTSTFGSSAEVCHLFLDLEVVSRSLNLISALTMVEIGSV